MNETPKSYCIYVTNPRNLILSGYVHNSPNDIRPDRKGARQFSSMEETNKMIELMGFVLEPNPNRPWAYAAEYY